MRRYFAVMMMTLLPVAVMAQAVPDPGADAGAFVQQLVDAVSKGNWRVVAILVAIVIVFGLRQVATRLPGKIGAFFQSARGGALTALLGGIVTALAGLLIGGGPLNVAVFINGIVLGVGAAGGWNILRRLIWSDAAPTAYPAAQPTTTTPPQ